MLGLRRLPLLQPRSSLVPGTARRRVTRCLPPSRRPASRIHRDWLQGNSYGGRSGPKKGDPCADAQGPLEHDHYFTGDRGFGSHDQSGEEVDGGDFEEVDSDTVAFPSHSKEFGYDGDILVDYKVNQDEVTFEVDMPRNCTDSCADAYSLGVVRVRLRALEAR